MIEQECVEKLKDGRLKLSESLFSPVPPSAFGVFDKRLKLFSSIIYCLLGYINGMAQNDTPKIRVFINTIIWAISTFIFGHPNLEPWQVGWLFWLHLDLHESYNGLPLVASTTVFLLVSFYVETKKKNAEIMASFRVCVDDIVEVAGLDHGCLAGPSVWSPAGFPTGFFSVLGWAQAIYFQT